MFPSPLKYYLPSCLIAATVFLFSACTDTSYQEKNVAERGLDFPVPKEKSSLVEYIVVLKENTSIANATDFLKKYQVQVIRDLKKNRYLIRLKNDPGIERLQQDIEDSEFIKYIQPNYRYKTQ